MYVAACDTFLVRGAPRLATATFFSSRILRKRFVFRVANDADVDLSYLESRYSQPIIRLYRIAVSRAEVVIAQTERQQQLLDDHFNVEASLVPNGYDLPAPSELLSHEKRQHILWVGSSDPEKKNPRLFLQLAKELPNLEFTMVSQPIAGHKKYHRKLLEEASSVKNLNFTGPVAPNEIHDYYRAAMLLVNTSDYEGFPNTFLEAWRYETPIVSLYFDLDSVLKNELGGIWSGSMEKLATAVEQLASNPSRRADLGADGRSHMKENYSLSRVVDLYEDSFERALK
jgi:glycosyltransferase involved in cell wall biosynthesis